MIRTLKEHRITSGLLAIAAALVATGGIWAITALSGRGPIIVHFNDLQGITASGGLGSIYFAAITGVLAVILNGLLAFALEERGLAFFGRLTVVLTLVFAVLLFIAFTAIISVN